MRSARKTANARGYNYRWQQARDRHIHRYPLCAECQRQGVVKAAAEVDHIIPHEGDQTLFWDEGNWQSLCRDCHIAKSAMESKGSAMLPSWLPRPTKPLMVVCGPPGAGKTTYVRTHATDRDLALDLDDIAVERGFPLDGRTEAQMHVAIRERNRRLAAFCEDRTQHERCWLIATAGKVSHREFWMGKGAKLIELHPGVDVCKQRIAQQVGRQAWARQRIAAVEAWR